MKIKLSSSWTSFSMYLSVILIISMSFVFVFFYKHQEFHFGMIIGFTLFFAISFLVFYLFFYTCNAYITENKLSLQKVLRKKVEFDFTQIVSLKSFQYKRTKYITIEIQKEHNETEKFIIINSYSLLSTDKIDAEKTLVNILNAN